MKMRPPWSRVCHAQPASVTSWFTSVARSCPQVAVCMQYSLRKSSIVTSVLLGSKNHVPVIVSQIPRPRQLFRTFSAASAVGTACALCRNTASSLAAVSASACRGPYARISSSSARRRFSSRLGLPLQQILHGAVEGKGQAVEGFGRGMVDVLLALLVHLNGTQADA